MRKSSRGNPYHDERGRFASANTHKVISERSEEEYKARTIARIKQIESEQRNQGLTNIVNGSFSDEDVKVLMQEAEYQETLLRKYYENKEPIPSKEIERRNTFRIAAMAYMKACGEETENKYKINNEWTISRLQEQNNIYQEYVTKIQNTPVDGKCLISGGLGGAGKSTVLRDCIGVDESQYVTINADDIKEIMARKNMVPTFRGLTPMECSELVHEEASMLSKRILNKAAESKTNIILDITMSSYGSVKKRCDILKANGYNKIQPIFVDIKPETSRERAIRRYIRGMEKYTVQHKGCGGRPLPNHVIDNNITKSKYHSQNAETLVNLSRDSIFTEIPIIYDNDGDAPIKVEWNMFSR